MMMPILFGVMRHVLSGPFLFNGPFGDCCCKLLIYGTTADHSKQKYLPLTYGQNKTIMSLSGCKLTYRDVKDKV